MTGDFSVNEPLTPGGHSHAGVPCVDPACGFLTAPRLLDPTPVKEPLTPAARRERRRRHVETADFGAFARRIVAAYGRRVADRDVEALAGLADLAKLVDSYTLLSVANLRTEAGGGYSWAAIGDALGITRQAAQQRYGARIGEAAK